MEKLQVNLSKVRIPEHTTRIYKHECCVSFDTPKSEGGLYVDMNSFVAFGKDYVAWNFEKTGNPVYFHIRQSMIPAPDDRPFKKPTRLAIGGDGGFDNNDPEYEESHSIVILPDYVTFSFPSVELPEKVRLAANAILTAESAERKDQLVGWTADKKKTSPYALGLKQINNGIMIPPAGWKCAKCDMQENLWLNLSDGMILCGRRNWDGSGGNNHAIEHYKETGFPLAVKLGTITADLEAADVFSYPEDGSVIDPQLEQHLVFFGIDISKLQKTEMTTEERELDANINYDWNRIQENNDELEDISGPGFTGLINLGNSCYMSATMQVVLSTRSFCSKYYMNQPLKEAFDKAPTDPNLDINMQLTKLAHGLLSGKYSAPDLKDGIRPQMFKSVIAASHPEFSSMRQQDALEFFLHFLDQVERVNNGKYDYDPSRSFKFGVEDRISCSSGKVAYSRRHDYILSLNIPLEAAVNKEVFGTSNKSKPEKNFEAKDSSSEEILRLRVPLDACFKNFLDAEEIDDFYSTFLKAKTTAQKSTRLTSFPDILVLHMRKFVMEEGWVPKKLDVYVDVPDIIDINHMRSMGQQPHEELLPECGDIEADHPVASEEIVAQLVSMGFKQLSCEKAAINTSNAGLEEAMNWLLSHMDDPDIDVPISHNIPDIDPSKLETLISFGFEEAISRKALKASRGDIEVATEWILTNPDASASDLDANSANPATEDSGLPDGEGNYKLFGIVSHIGTSTHCGHYVAHILKDDKWVIFNDNKVKISLNPPKDMGYLYFFQRI